MSNKASIDGVEESETGDDDFLLVKSIHTSGSGNIYEMTVEKIDSVDKDKKLSGAQFEFYLVLPEGADLESNATFTVGDKVYSCYTETEGTEKEWIFATGDDGQHRIRGWSLEPGNYYILKEIEAPEGYDLLQEPILFYYGEEDQIDKTKYPTAVPLPLNRTLTVENTSAVILPETGGSGTLLYLVTGLLLMCGSTIVLETRKRMRQAH